MSESEFFSPLVTSDHIQDFAAALAKAQGEVEQVEKDSENPHFRSKYATLASVVKAIRKAFAKHGLSHVQAPSTSTDDGGPMDVCVTTRLLHESGQWIEATLTMRCARPDNPQAIGAAITYARRYALASMAGVAPDDDDDAESVVAPTRKGKPAKKAPAKPAKNGKADADYVAKFTTRMIATTSVDAATKVGTEMNQEFKDDKIDEPTYLACRALGQKHLNLLRTPKEESDAKTDAVAENASGHVE